MKKNSIYALMSAIALAGAVGFCGCSSEEEVINNPNYDPETNKVKTEFVINVTQPEERTRQASADVGNDDFQGINNIQLLCLTAAPGTAATADNAITSDKKLTLTYSTTPTPALDGSDPTKTNNSSRVYTMYIPVGTSNFLFYATARADAPTTVADKFKYGVLDNNLGTATKVTAGTGEDVNLQFSLQSIVSTASTVTTPQTTLLTILNGIAGAKVDDDNTWAGKHGNLTNSYRALGAAYDKFTNQAGAGDVRQGSSVAVFNMVKDLFDNINDIYTNGDEAAKTLAKTVLDKIAEYFTVTVSGTTYTWGAAYKAETDGATFNTNKYPEAQNLPAGSAVIKFDGTPAVFSYINDGTSGAAAVSAAYSNFTYPSALTYYCNSTLWQTSTSQNSNAYPTNSAEWLSKTWASDGWSNSAVTAGTRAVAMKKNITYGAAQLHSIIKLSGSDFTDNAFTVTNGEEANAAFSSTNPIVLKLHGLLIGGQPDAAQYEYLPYGAGISKVIYDKISDAGTTLSTSDTENYTLVLDNYLTAGQSTVNVALEMTADKDFYGKSGKIKAGQKFYLIGELNPASPASGSSITWANTSFESTDTGYNADRVFIRDAKTDATFRLTTTSLQKAYSTIPDLRSTQMLFGISVDLKWKAGLEFSVDL